MQFSALLHTFLYLRKFNMALTQSHNMDKSFLKSEIGEWGYLLQHKHKQRTPVPTNCV